MTGRRMSGKTEATQGSAHAARQTIIRSYILMATWITLSATVILFNKWILSYAGFQHPIALTMIHMAFCSVVTAVIMHFGHFVGLHVGKIDMQAATCATNFEHSSTSFPA